MSLRNNPTPFMCLLPVPPNKWRIKLNESKSVHTDFTNKKITQQPIFINGTQVPYANTAKYLGMTLDAKLRWKEHIKKKRDQLNIKFRKMYWLLGRKSELSIHNTHNIQASHTSSLELWYPALGLRQ
jgi:hypothetical protein